MTDETEDLPSGEETTLADMLDEAPVKRARVKKVEAEVRLHPILSNEDFLAAQGAARKAIDKERRAAAMKEVQAQEAQRLRVEEGLTTGITDLDDLVDVQIDLPLWTPSISVNRFPYMHGRAYRVARHIYNSLMEQMQRARRHDDQIEGRSMRESMAYAHRQSANVLNGNTGAAVRDPRFDA